MRYPLSAMVLKHLVLLLTVSLASGLAHALPKGFVYLSDVDASIIQDIRYDSRHNFVGRPIAGYGASKCILTNSAAKKLKQVQAMALKKGYSLKVYDCYRPQRAVDDFYRWSQNRQKAMKREFFPREDKRELFKKGYIAKYSGHSRGSTVDVTLVELDGFKNQQIYSKNTRLTACYAPFKRRFKDNSIDMGTGYDCLDKAAHAFYKKLSKTARANRTLLRRLMMKNNFYPYNKEWWHFTLRKEPHRRRYFNFVIR